VTQGRVRLDDGAATTLERWGNRGPLVLAVHGMTSSRKSWERLARHLDGRFRVAAYDQRGHGDSAEVVGPMTLTQGVADLKAVAGALGEPVDVLLGHSWGGAVALLAAAELPVKRAVAIDPMIRQVDDAWYDEYLAELAEAFAYAGAQRDARTREEYATWDPLDVEAKVHAVAHMTPAPIAGLHRENPPQSWDLRETMARFSKPALLALAAEGESINDEATLGDVVRRHGPAVEIVRFEGAGHNLHRTHFPAFALALDAFLARPES